jgi:hypothetical protein
LSEGGYSSSLADCWKLHKVDKVGQVFSASRIFRHFMNIRLFLVFLILTGFIARLLQPLLAFNERTKKAGGVWGIFIFL